MGSVIEFDTEFAVANRGILELTEMLKIPKEFLHDMGAVEELEEQVGRKKPKKQLRSLDDDWEA